MANEQRQSPRFRISVNVLLHVGGGGRTVRGKSLDLSASGIFVQVSERVPVGQRVHVLAEAGPDGVIFTAGVVVHAVKGYGVGIRFTAVSPRNQERLAIVLGKAKPTAA